MSVIPPNLEVLADVRLGREVVANEKLQLLRERLGLTRSAMAELLNTSIFTYSSWEKRPNTAVWPSTAGRIGRFYQAATRQLDILDEELISIGELMPLHGAASVLGVPQEVLFKQYREGQLEAVDLGILGLWVYRDYIEAITG